MGPSEGGLRPPLPVLAPARLSSLASPARPPSPVLRVPSGLARPPSPALSPPPPLLALPPVSRGSPPRRAAARVSVALPSWRAAAPGRRSPRGSRGFGGGSALWSRGGRRAPGGGACGVPGRRRQPAGAGRGSSRDGGGRQGPGSGRGTPLGRLTGVAPARRVPSPPVVFVLPCPTPLSLVVGHFSGRPEACDSAVARTLKHAKNVRLLAVDHSARASMKNAASCEN